MTSPRSEHSRINRRKPIALQLVRSVLAGDITPRELEIETAGEGFPPGRLRLEVLEPGPGVGAGILVRREPERPRSEPT